MALVIGTITLICVDTNAKKVDGPGFSESKQRTMSGLFFGPSGFLVGRKAQCFSAEMLWEGRIPWKSRRPQWLPFLENQS